jgi:SAM-dependent methyltransferase
MTSEWERFAAEDPLFYIDPALGTGASIEDFIAAGAPLATWATDWAGALPSHDRALEIGCGVGRNSVHFARRFRRVDAVDVSPTMIRIAREQDPPDNVVFAATSGSDLAVFGDGAFDLVFSNLVFQHIPDDAVVAAYVAEIGRVLRPSGAAVLQFDTRALGVGARLARALPDPLLPAARRRHIRRYPRSPETVRAWAADAGLVVAEERDPGSAEHWLRLTAAAG